MSASERRPRIVKVKDLKPKRIKDYLEDFVYDQVKQLIVLRHKPITQQDALPRSDSQLCSRHPLCHPVEAEYRSSSIEEVEALTRPNGAQQQQWSTTSRWVGSACPCRWSNRSPRSIDEPTVTCHDST
ncbi:hypothetical protein GQ457_09G017210 [Hibiscus cannabinus]